MQATGVITDLDHPKDFSIVVPLPAAVLRTTDFQLVSEYKNSTKSPIASILKSEAIKIHSAPVVASFSSRGPNAIYDHILKPDITAPGVEILAAFSPKASVSRTQDKRSVNFTFLSL